MNDSIKEDKDYLIKICGFDKLEYKNIPNLISLDKCKNYSLWAIFGKNKKTENRECLHVGSGKHICSELQKILKLMISKPNKVSKSTAFYPNVYDFTTYMDKDSTKYRMIYENYTNFEIYIIDTEKYLDVEDVGDYNKINYAEVKFAYENKALLWNPAPSFHGNQEQKILREVSNKNKSV